jgi:hypothetical protein
MTFLPSHLTDAANRYVEQQPADRTPRFPRKEFAGAVVIRGGILRYSTTTPVVTTSTPIPGGYRISTAAQIKR